MPELKGSSKKGTRYELERPVLEAKTALADAHIRAEACHIPEELDGEVRICGRQR